MTCERLDHRIEDFWPETVVVCVCGWRTAEATMKCAVDAWKQHACCCPSGSYDRSDVHEDYCPAGTKAKVGRRSRIRGVDLKEANVECARQFGWRSRKDFDDAILDECENGWRTEDELRQSACQMPAELPACDGSHSSDD